MYIYKNTTHNKNGKEVNMNTLQKICLSITIIGAINWGLIGLLDFNLVESLFGTESIVPRIIYSLVGIAGIYSISMLFTSRHAHD
jgi:uncharacterized membrane protein YuzA (DUF378 family)